MYVASSFKVLIHTELVIVLRSFIQNDINVLFSDLMIALKTIIFPG